MPLHFLKNITYSGWTLAVALAISAIAAWYSVIGLAAIFAGAFWPIVIMGGILEIAKITTTVWLHHYWHRAGRAIRTYLTVAVVMLASLTSMGIFGLLSKAHLEQTGAAEENTAQVERLTAEINRRTEIVRRAEERIRQYESQGTGADAQTQAQIDREQARIDQALARMEPAIREQQEIINGQTKLIQDRISRIDSDLSRLQTALERKEIAQAQGIVGVQPDGQIGPRTTQAFNQYRERLQAERAPLVRQLEQLNQNDTVRAARAEIARIRQSSEQQIAQSNELINRLRQQVGRGGKENIDGLVDEQQARIRTANQEIETLTEQRYRAQAEFRKVEAEVGPVKYIAALIYGDNPDAALLERAVRWVIILIVVVFDPLAIVLILAANNSLAWDRETRKLQAGLVEAHARPEPEPEVREVSAAPPPEPEPEPEPLEAAPPAKKPITFLQYPDIVYYYRPRNPVPGPEEPLGVPVQSETETPPLAPDEPQPEPQITADTVAVDTSQSEIKTEGVTEAAQVFNLDSGYVTYEGKLISVAALKELRPDLVVGAAAPNEISFGVEFPRYARAGDQYIRIDTAPHRVYKFNGVKWMAVDKSQTTSYLDNSAYMQYLISIIEQGQYDPDHLTDSEREEIESYLGSRQ